MQQRVGENNEQARQRQELSLHLLDWHVNVVSMQLLYQKGSMDWALMLQAQIQ